MLAIKTLSVVTATPRAGRIADCAKVETYRSAFPGVKVFTFKIIVHIFTTFKVVE